MMPRMSRRVDDVQKEFSEDFTVVNENLLLCKFCDSIVKWQKKTRIIEHLNTKMHAERKELKMQRFMAEMQSQAGNDEDDYDQDDDVASVYGSMWDQEEHKRRDMTQNSNEAQYSLKWNNHQNNMIDVFNRLLGDEQFTDVLIAAEGRKIRAHKVVLSACSSYFENLFMTFDEKNQIVILKDANFIDVFALVEFMYKGEANVGQEQLTSLLRTAENLKIKGLSETSSHTGGGGGNVRSGGYRNISSHSIKYNCQRSTIVMQSSPPKLTPAPFTSKSSTPTSLITALTTASPNGNDNKVIKRTSLEPKRGSITDVITDNSSRLHHPQSQRRQSSPVNPSLIASSSGITVISSQNTSGGTVTVSPTTNPLKHSIDVSPISSSSAGGEPAKRKRGRPRILDEDTDIYRPFGRSEEQNQQALANLVAQGNGSSEAGSGGLENPLRIKKSNKMPTPGGPLTEERIKELGVIKMNDYLSNGTRPQFWEEYFVKVIMHAVKNKEIDVKGAAELLGVSYGTLYGRYRELFGYVKHAWNLGGRPMKLIPMPRHLGLGSGGFTREPSAAIWTDPSNQRVLDQLKNGQVTIRQAAELLGIDPALLAYQLSGKFSGNGSPSKLSQLISEESIYDAGAMMDYDTGMMAVPADMDMEDEDGDYEEHMIAPDIQIDDDISEASEREHIKKHVIKSSHAAETAKGSVHDVGDKEYEEEENGVPAPITIAERSKNLTKDDVRRVVY